MQSFNGSYDDFADTIIRGDDYEFPFQVRTPQTNAAPPYTAANTDPVDISGWQELWCTAKAGPRLGDPADDTGAAFQVTRTGGGIVVTDAANGKAKVVLAASVSRTLKNRELRMDVQGRDASGKIHTVCTGILTVNADPTRAM
jgi:hypothetical protein